jgi:hypothetical protein
MVIAWRRRGRVCLTYINLVLIRYGNNQVSRLRPEGPRISARANASRAIRRTSTKRSLPVHTSRRHFIILAASLASTAVLHNETRAAAPELSESDPTAQTLGYKSDATQTDAAKYPKYQAGQACANCQLYQGKPGDAAGPCSVFSGKQVSAKGWCSAYVKKA